MDLSIEDIQRDPVADVVEAAEKLTMGVDLSAGSDFTAMVTTAFLGGDKTVSAATWDSLMGVHGEMLELSFLRIVQQDYNRQAEEMKLEEIRARNFYGCHLKLFANRDHFSDPEIAEAKILSPEAEGYHVEYPILNKGGLVMNWGSRPFSVGLSNNLFNHGLINSIIAP